MKKQWKEYYLSQKTVSTAIFEYLQRRNIKVNRKRGIHDGRNIGGFLTGNKYVYVETSDL